MTSSTLQTPVGSASGQGNCPKPEDRISLDRQARFGAGTMAILGVLLGFLVHPAFYALGLVVGVGLIVAGATDVCGLTLVLAKMPWNRHRDAGCAR